MKRREPILKVFLPDFRVAVKSRLGFGVPYFNNRLFNERV